MGNFKKIIALVLAFIVMIAPVNVRAAEVLSDKLAKGLTAKFFETSYPDDLADIVELFLKVEETDKIGEAYGKVFEALAQGQKDKLEDYGATTNAIMDFVKYINDTKNNIDTDNLVTYIRVENKESFDKAFANHIVDINVILEKQNITTDILNNGFSKLDKVFAMIKDARKASLNINIFKYNTKSKIISLEELNTRNLLSYDLVGIDDVDSAIAALNEFVSYTNNNIKSHDRGIMVNYLSSLDILYKYTPGTGGGTSSSGGGGITPPSTDSSLSDLIKDIKDPAKQKEAINKTKAVLDDLSNKVAEVKDEKSAYEAVKNVTNTLKDATTIVKAIKNPADQKAVIDKVTGVLQSTVQALDMIDNAGAIKLKVEAMIKEVGSLKVAAGKSLGNATKIDQALVRLAEKAIEKAATIKAISSDLSKLDFTAQAAKATKAKAEMQKALTASEIKGNKAIETKVTVEVPTAKDAKEVEVTLPDLTEVFKAVDKVKVKSCIASFELEAGTFGDTEAKNLKLSAIIVDKMVLTESQMAKLPLGVTNVIDLKASVNGSQVSMCNKPIKVSIPYILKKGKNPAKVSVYLLTDEGKIEKVAGKYNPITGQITVMSKYFSKYFIAVSNDTFSDIASYSWAKEQIETLAGKGIIGRIGDDKFDPSANISRASFVVWIVRMLQLDGDVSTLTFEDVSVDAWYAKEVSAAVEAGIIKGRATTIFAPNDTITREEVAVVISNAMKILGYNIEETPYIITNNVVDATDIAKWAKNAAATVYRDGIITGKPGSKFDPKGKATRAEAAVMMYRLYFGD